MPLLEEEYRKEEKINGVIYDMSPSPNYQHGLVDGNIYRIISTGLQEPPFKCLRSHIIITSVLRIGNIQLR